MLDDAGVLCSICLSKGHTANACPLRSRFKNVNGTLMKAALFFEQCHYSTGYEYAIYTLRDKDHTSQKDITYPSIYRLYMEEADLTEYQFAIKYFYSWDHWQSIAECAWMKPLLAKWRSELEIKLKAKAIKEILEEAEGGGKNAFQANKWIIDKGWATNEPNRRGRPSKNEIRQAAQEEAFSDKQITEDMKRLGLN